MGLISNGVYAITRIVEPGEQFLTLPAGDASPGRSAVLRPTTEKAGELQWEVRAFARKSVVICNVESGIFLSFRPGDPAAGAEVGGWPKPREWRLEPAGSPPEFLILTSGRRTGDLVLDLDPESAGPLRTTLKPLPAGDTTAAWKFTRLE